MQLDLIPADMVQTIEVNKVVTADMDGDAIGGSINLITKNTPYRRIFNATAGSGYNAVSKKAQLNLGLTYGDRFLNDKLGLMISGSYQYAPGGSDNTEFEYDVDDDGNVVLKEAQVRQYYVTRERQSYSLALDYEFNPDHRISFKGIYNRRNDWENRYRAVYKDLDESDPAEQSIELQTKGGLHDTKNARLERQQTMDFTLDGEHNLGGRLLMDWAASYSRASEDRPNERYFGLKMDNNTGSNLLGTFHDVGGRAPYSTLAFPALSDEGWELDELTNSDQSIYENEWKFRLNFELPLAKGLFGNTLRFGGKYTNKTKDRETEWYKYDGEFDDGDAWRNNGAAQIRSGFMAGDHYPEGTAWRHRLHPHDGRTGLRGNVRQLPRQRTDHQRLPALRPETGPQTQPHARPPHGAHRPEVQRPQLGGGCRRERDPRSSSAPRSPRPCRAPNTRPSSPASTTTAPTKRPPSATPA